MMINPSIEDIKRAENPELAYLNKERQLAFRNHAEFIKSIYDYAKMILDSTLGDSYTLPIDIEKVAESLGFAISKTDFSEDEETYLIDHDCQPLAQISMSKQMNKSNPGEIFGTVRTSHNLNDFSTRFVIAQQLGYYALRQNAKIGFVAKFKMSAGFYPSLDSDEMLNNIFACALLLPYHLYIAEKDKYESDRTHWPLVHYRWVSYLRQMAEMPEYCIFLAGQELNYVDIALKYEQAQNYIRNYFASLGITKEQEDAGIALYAVALNNLEAWGYTALQSTNGLFGINITEEGRLLLAEYLHDFYLTHPDIDQDLWPEKLFELIKNNLSAMGISSSGIKKIIHVDPGEPRKRNK